MDLPRGGPVQAGYLDHPSTTGVTAASPTTAQSRTEPDVLAHAEAAGTSTHLHEAPWVPGNMPGGLAGACAPGCVRVMRACRVGSTTTMVRGGNLISRS